MRHHGNSKQKLNVNPNERPSLMFSGLDSMKKPKARSKFLIQNKDMNSALTFSSFFNRENEFKYLDSFIPFELFETSINPKPENINYAQNNAISKIEMNNSEITKNIQEDITEYIEQIHKESKNSEQVNKDISTLKAHKSLELSSENEFNDISIKKEIKIYTKRKIPLYFH